MRHRTSKAYSGTIRVSLDPTVFTLSAPYKSGTAPFATSDDVWLSLSGEPDGDHSR